MSNELVKPTNEVIKLKSIFEREDVKQKFKEMLGKRSTAFVTSVLQIASQNEMLSKADPISIYQSAAVAATLDLPLNANLGFAYILAYNQKQSDGTWKQVAQFQMGYKGFIQLAQRSGQFQTIAASEIYEGQLVEQNPLTGFVFDFTKKTSDKIIGYASYFKLLNGFEKTLYMSADELNKHGKSFSQTFKKGFGLWKDNFDAMAKKTVLKLLLSKFAPLSVEMQRAVITDQAIINDAETEDVTYVDNEAAVIDKEAERMVKMIDDAKTVEELDNLFEHVKDEQMDYFLAKKETLTIKK